MRLGQFESGLEISANLKIIFWNNRLGNQDLKVSPAQETIWQPGGIKDGERDKCLKLLDAYREVTKSSWETVCRLHTCAKLIPILKCPQQVMI